jgi:pectate lyase
MGAQVLVQNDVFVDFKLAMATDLDSDQAGYLCDVGNVLTGTSTKRITQTCSFKPSYSYSLDPASSVPATVAASAAVGIVAP